MTARSRYCCKPGANTPLSIAYETRQRDAVLATPQSSQAHIQSVWMFIRVFACKACSARCQARVPPSGCRTMSRRLSFAPHGQRPHTPLASPGLKAKQGREHPRSCFLQPPSLQGWLSYFWIQFFVLGYTNYPPQQYSPSTCIICTLAKQENGISSRFRNVSTRVSSNT